MNRILRGKEVGIEKWFGGWYIVNSNMKMKLFGVCGSVEFVVFNGWGSEYRNKIEF